MNSIGRSLLAGLLLFVVAFGFARLSQLLAAQLPWPLLAIFIGGGLGTFAALIWQQQWVNSWSVMIVLCLLAACFLSVAEHYFAWENLKAAQEAEWNKVIREQPVLTGIPAPFNPPTWAEFMSGGAEPVRTWAWWICDASAKGLVALAVLYFRKGLPGQQAPAESVSPPPGAVS